MEDSLGVEWLKKIFLPYCGPQRPQVLVLDQHHSHEAYFMLKFAKEQDIHILAFPPHTCKPLASVPGKGVLFSPEQILQKYLLTIYVILTKSRCQKGNIYKTVLTGLGKRHDPTQSSLRVWGHSYKCLRP